MLTSFSCQKCFFTPSSLPPTSIPPPHPLSPPSPPSPPPPSLHPPPSILFFLLPLPLLLLLHPSIHPSTSLPLLRFPRNFLFILCCHASPFLPVASPRCFRVCFFHVFFFFLDASGSVSTTRLSPWRKENTNNGTAAEFLKENEKVAHRDVEGFH